MSEGQQLSPEELIKQIENQNLKISPIIELKTETEDGQILLACDCSGCNNPAICFYCE